MTTHFHLPVASAAQAQVAVVEALRQVSRAVEDRGSWDRWDVIHTGVVLLLIVGVYAFFTG